MLFLYQYRINTDPTPKQNRTKTDLTPTQRRHKTEPTPKQYRLNIAPTLTRYRSNTETKQNQRQHKTDLTPKQHSPNTKPLSYAKPSTFVLPAWNFSAAHASRIEDKRCSREPPPTESSSARMASTICFRAIFSICPPEKE